MGRTFDVCPAPISRRRFVASAAVAGAAALTASSREEAMAEAAAESVDRDCIDAHVHVWTADTARFPLKPDMTATQMAVPSFTPEKLMAVAGPCGVNRVVLIQMSYYLWDNRYMLDAIARFPKTFVGIARVDADARPGQEMLRLAKHGVRGVRIVGVGAGAERWLEGPGMAEIWQTASEHPMVIGTLIGAGSLESLDAMCAKYPAAPVVVDHFARIGFDGQVRPAEVDALCRLARHKNTYVKVSAFYALGKKQAPYTDLGPMVRQLLGAFGRQRLMWASDSPFQVIRPHTYRDSIELVRSRLDFLTAEDRAWLLRRTAERLFFA
jgi:predicted TIM-barrel fold metal-dependent hydrolase